MDFVMGCHLVGMGHPGGCDPIRIKVVLISGLREGSLFSALQYMIRGMVLAAIGRAASPLEGLR